MRKYWDKLTDSYYRVAICGDRDWKYKKPIREELEILRNTFGLKLIVACGMCRGADILAWEICEELGIDRIAFPANWSGRHNSAGPFRNMLIINFFRPDKVIAFHNDIGKSKGTKHMLKIAEKANCVTKLIVCKE